MADPASRQGRAEGINLRHLRVLTLVTEKGTLREAARDRLGRGRLRRPGGARSARRRA